MLNLMNENLDIDNLYIYGRISFEKQLIDKGQKGDIKHRRNLDGYTEYSEDDIWKTIHDYNLNGYS